MGGELLRVGREEGMPFEACFFVKVTKCSGLKSGLPVWP